MVIYNDKNVYDAALERIRYIFNDFENVIVGFSGGKDSTTCLNLSLKVAEELNRLPLKVLFLDQEAEWQNTIDYVKSVMYDKRVEPLWFQIPLKLFNATSTEDPWLMCWEEGKEWMRDKDPIAITENKYNCDRFAQLFTEIVGTDYADKRTAYISGVRCEESPSRKMGLTEGKPTYKWITWGKILNKELSHYTFYPLYDWSFMDIWKSIHDNNWAYNKIYDYQYQYGIPVQRMRVSNVHHETAVSTLYYLQEIEKETWQKLTKRISGINTTGQLKDKAIKIEELPYMFQNWKEYRDYLLENLISNEEIRKSFKSEFNRYDDIFTDSWIYTGYHRMCIKCIMTNDYHFTQFGNFIKHPKYNGYKKWKTNKMLKTNKYYDEFVRLSDAYKHNKGILQ